MQQDLYTFPKYSPHPESEEKNKDWFLQKHEEREKCS